MATVTKKYLTQEQQFGGTPYGNGTTLQFNLTTTAAGAVYSMSSARSAVSSPASPCPPLFIAPR